MTTGELRELLLNLDPSGKLEVINTRYSDYFALTEDDVGIVEAVKKDSACYIMRAHETLSPKDAAAVRRFVHFAGN